MQHTSVSLLKKLTLTRRFGTTGPRRLKLLAAIIPALLCLALLACTSSAPPKPQEIMQGDTCLFCKKPITEKQFAAEFVTKDGFVRKFDEVACMLEHIKKVKKANISAFFVTDYDSSKWMKAEDATFVRSNRFQTPNSGGILAFSQKPRAQSLATQFQAEVLSFADLTK